MPTFLSPMALWGLLLASAPIIIHLLNRRRFKVVSWAAMEFLLASSRKNYRRIRIEQLILLALRVAMIAVLILLVARPVVSRRALAPLAERRRFVLLLFDASMSMGYRDGTATVYDRALAFAEQLMGSLREGDTWAVVRAAGRGRPAVQEPSYDLDAARAAVARDRLALSDSDSNLPRALEAAEETLARSQAPVKQVYLLTDLQRASWTGPGAALTPEDVERTRRIGQAARVTVVDLGAAQPANLAVTALETEAPLVVAGGEAVIRAHVANYGPDPASNVVVHFLVDGFRQEKSPPRALAPGETAQWEFRHTFRTAGVHTVTAELEPSTSLGSGADNLVRDDRRSLALDARESIAVLCVDGEPAGSLGVGAGADTFAGEADYLRRSLRPGGPEPDGLSLFRPEVITVEALSGADLSRYDAVVLANVERLPDPQVVTLDSYVRSGGALLVFLGEKVDSGFYNRVLYRDGQGLLPCSLGAAVGDANDRKKAARISDQLGDHPFLRLFRQQQVIRLSSPLFYRYYQLAVRDPHTSSSSSLPSSSSPSPSPSSSSSLSSSRVVARFDNGSPAIVEGRHGKGRVVVFASTADDAWNDMPSWPAYLTLMQEVMAQVARDPGTSRNLTVGEALVCHVSPEHLGKRAQLLRPGETRPLSLEATASGGLVAVVCDRTDRAGLYEISLPGSPPQHFAVNVPAHESDLRRLSEAELRKLLPGLDFDYQRGGVSRAPAAAGEGGELWRSLAYVLLGLVLLESILAQRFGR